MYVCLEPKVHYQTCPNVSLDLEIRTKKVLLTNDLKDHRRSPIHYKTVTQKPKIVTDEKLSLKLIWNSQVDLD